MKRKQEHLKLVEKEGRVPAWKRIFRALGYLLVVLCLAYLLAYAESFFRLENVTVLGTDAVGTSAVLEAGEIEKGMSMILFREQEIAARILQDLPRVAEVEITRTLPDRVTVEVTERIPGAYVMTADGFWLIATDTVCLEYSSRPWGDYPLVAGVDGRDVIPGQPLACAERRKALQGFFSVFPDPAPFKVEKINLASSYNLVLHTACGREIWLGEAEEIIYKLHLVEKSIPYIDPAAEARLDVRCGKRLVVSGSALVKNPEKEVDP